MKEETKKGLAVVGILAAIAGGAALAKKAEAEPEPPEPPPEGTGRVQGYVIDSATQQVVPQAEIYVDGQPNTTADLTGGFRTSYMDYGPHTLTIYGDGYETADFQIMLEQSLLELNFALDPIGEIPGFPDDVDVTDIRIQPPTARLGETVNIGVYLLIPYPTPIPETVTGTITVDGTQLTKTIDTRGIRNPGMWFQYTPPTAGTYKVIAKGKSATFEVLEDVVGTFFCPFGCVAPTEDGAWNSKQDLMGSWITLDEPRWYPEYPAGENCVVVPRFYGGGSGATGYEGTVYCPLCREAMRTGRRPGDHSYMWCLAQMLFNHIERAHPGIQWDRPPAWLQVEGLEAYCLFHPLYGPHHCRYQLEIHPVLADIKRGLAMVSLGDCIITVKGFDWATYTWLDPIEFTLTIDNYGDRLTLDVQTGGISIVRWADLV